MNSLNLTIGNFSEQALETTNRTLKTMRKGFTRKYGSKEAAGNTFYYLIASFEPKFYDLEFFFFN